MQLRDARVMEILRGMDAAGQLRLPAPWINEDGQLLPSWDIDANGDTFACYLDMLGLNGRPIYEPPANKGYTRRRKKAPSVMS